MTESTLSGRRLGGYELTEAIGRGGGGIVYRARAVDTGAPAALKVMSLDGLDDLRDIDRFEREARLAAALDHPHIVATYGAGRADGYLFLAMELVEGQSLRRLLRDRGRLDPERALSIAGQVFDALALAHQHRVVHRDIKAENVLVQADDWAKITDFGIAKIDDGQVLTRADEILGTVEYMAPEQILGEPATPASDLYAAGVLLYEMLTGALPLTGDSPATLVYHQLNENPQPPSRLVPTLPRALDRLVLRLLDKEPENRPASAVVARRVLDEIRHRQAMRDLPGLPAGDSETETLDARRFHPRFTGRQAELDALCDHFDEAATGGRLVFVSGEAGLGKTRLADEFSARVKARGGRWVRGTCFFEHGLGPFMPILDAVGQLLADPDADLGGVLTDIAPELAPLVKNPDTAARIRTGFAAAFADENDPDHARQRFFDAVAELFAAAARQTPLVVFFEDMHWADEGSQQLLHYLERRAADAPVLYLVTYRPEALSAPDEAPPLAGMLGQLAADDRLREVRLEPLPWQAVDLFARSLFLEADFGPDFVDYLAERSQGNPLIALEILKLLKQQGALYCEDGAWTAQPDYARTAIPDRVNALVLRRIEALDDGLRELLEAAAVLGVRFDLRLLERAVGRGRIPLLKALYRLEKQYRLIEQADGQYRFTHSIIREVLCAEIPPELRVEYHRVAAAALDEQRADGERVDVEAMGHHLYGAGDWERARPYLRQCGEAAFALFGWRLAVACFARLEDACRRAGDAGDDLLLALRYGGRAHEQLGAFAAALEKFTALRDEARALDRADDEAEAWVQIGRTREHLRRFAEARDAYQQALDLLDGAPGATRGRALLNLGSLCYEEGQYQTAESHWSEAHDLLRAAAAPEAANAVNNLAVVATIRGDFDRAWGLYEEVLAEEGEEGPPTVLTYQNMGMLRADQERWAEALELYDRALALCRRTRCSLHEPLVQLNRVEALIGSGDLAAARAAAGLSLAGFRRLDDALGIADALRLYGRICRVEQSWDEGRDCLERSVALNREFGETVSLGETLYELGLLHRDAGARESATEPLQEAGQIFDQIGAAPDLERVQEALAELETT